MPENGYEYENYELSEEFRKHLGYDEHLIWCGRTQRFVAFRTFSLRSLIGLTDVPFIAAGVLFIILVFLNKTSLGDKILVCSLMGLFVIVGIMGLFRGMRVPKGGFAITDKRALALVDGKFSEVKLVDVCRILNKKKRAKVGDIMIYDLFEPYSNKYRCIWFSGVKRPGHIEDILRNQIKSARSKSGLGEIDLPPSDRIQEFGNWGR